jgi:hypothetical protein
MNKYAKKGFSPHCQLLVAQAKVDGLNPALVLSKAFSPAIFEMRSGFLGDWENSTVIGKTVMYFKQDGDDTIRLRKETDVKIIQAGIPIWFCVKSKKDPKIYWIGTCGDHASGADIMMSPYSLLAPGQESKINSLQISGL